MKTQVVDSLGEVVPDGHVGEVVVTSPSLFSGYLGAASSSVVFHPTGDLALKWDQDLYILGRVGSSIKINGKFVTAEDVETLISDKLNLNHSKVIAVLRDLGVDRSPQVLIVVQQKVDELKIPLIIDVLTAQGISPGYAAIAVLPPRAIARTTSGKPKRSDIWDFLSDNRTEGRYLFVGTCSTFRVDAEVLR